MRIETHWLPKAGHAEGEYEDAFGTAEPDVFPFRAVVADGATESAFSGGWARTLVREYLTRGTLVEAAAAARMRWSPPADGRWYVQAKAAEGAYAALLGLEIGSASDGDGTWRAESVGDCCLFHVRDKTVRLSWPFTDAADFHHRPSLLSSLSNDDDVRTTEGTWRRGDTFILATDALAAWLHVVGVDRLLESTDYSTLVDNARGSSLRNDDVTAVIIRP